MVSHGALQRARCRSRTNEWAGCPSLGEGFWQVVHQSPPGGAGGAPACQSRPLEMPTEYVCDGPTRAGVVFFGGGAFSVRHRPGEAEGSLSRLTYRRGRGAQPRPHALGSSPLCDVTSPFPGPPHPPPRPLPLFHSPTAARTGRALASAKPRVRSGPRLCLTLQRLSSCAPVSA